MHVFTVSETIDGAELQISLRLDSLALARYLGTSELTFDNEDEFSEELHPVRQYMAAIAARLPELHNSAFEPILQHQIELLERQNDAKQRELKRFRKKKRKAS